MAITYLPEGTIELYTRRCLVAILTIEKDVVTWPDCNERAHIVRRIRQESGFPDCVGLVDGTLIVFSQKPTLDGADYYSQKGCYGMSTMIICDDQKRIR